MTKPQESTIKKLHSIVNETHPVIVEIGAYRGSDSEMFLRTFNPSKLICFEPDPENCESFRNGDSKFVHTSAFGDSRCTLVEAAVTDYDGTTIFHRSSGLGRRASGSLNKPTGHLQAHKWCIFDEDVIVPAIKLDTWCKQHGIESISLIWADVNGAEAKMLEGAKEILRKTKYLYTECRPDNFELYAESITKTQILNLLPYFEEVLALGDNVLLRNREI